MWYVAILILVCSSSFLSGLDVLFFQQILRSNTKMTIQRIDGMLRDICISTVVHRINKAYDVFA